MNLIQSLISNDKYEYKCPYPMTPKGICIHNTANDASARNEVAYGKNNYNEVSYHIAVDDVEAIQWIPLNRNTWHSGDGGNGLGNRNYISIEICYSKSGGERFNKAENNCAELVAQLLKEYGWGVDKVKKHQDFSGKYCPHRTLDMGWQRFLNMIQVELDKLNGKGNIQQSSGEMYRIRKSWSNAVSQIGAFKDLENAKKSCKDGYSVFDSKGNKVYPISNPDSSPIISQTSSEKRYAENGTYYFNTAVTVRTAPEENAKTNVVYYAGESVIYHHVILNKNGFNWIEYARNNGTTGYLKVKDLATGESYGYAK